MTPDSVRADYARAMDRAGETVTIRRYSGSGASRTPADYANIRARVTAFEPHELVGGIIQGDRKLIVLAEDLEASGISLPLIKGDKAVVRGRELNIEGPNDNTRRIQGVLVAYDLAVRG